MPGDENAARAIVDNWITNVSTDVFEFMQKVGNENAWISCHECC
jgi:hypothetical protein